MTNKKYKPMWGSKKKRNYNGADAFFAAAPFIAAATSDISNSLSSDCNSGGLSDGGSCSGF